MNQSIPFSFLTVEVAANDGNPHQVQHYTDISKDWVYGYLQPEWGVNITGGTVSHQFSFPNQSQFLEVDGRVTYGSGMYSTKQVRPPIE